MACQGFSPAKRQGLNARRFAAVALASFLFGIVRIPVRAPIGLLAVILNNILAFAIRHIAHLS